MKMLIFTCTAILFMVNVKGQHSRKTTYGAPIVENIGKTDTLRYLLNFRHGGIYQFTIRQQGLGVYYQLDGPSGKPLLKSDMPEDVEDTERFEFDASSSGSYTLMITRFKHPENPPSGKFTLQVDSLGPQEIARRRTIRKALRKENNKMVSTRDIDHFWTAFDRLKKCKNYADSCLAFQEEYLDKATNGFRDFIRIRNLTAEKYVAMASRYPKFLSSIRSKTYLVKQWQENVKRVFERFAKLYPAFKPTKVCFAIGILNTGGTVSNRFVLIGTELAASTAYADLSEFSPGAFKDKLAYRDDLTDRIVSLIAHECVHTQQPAIGLPADQCPLLAQSLREGAADFIGELVVGKSFTGNHTYGDANEKTLWQKFRKQLCSGKTEDWLYNATTIKDRPADLGYYIGYRIAKTYYTQAKDKQQAVSAIMGITDPQDFLTKSGYDPK
ncbi:hypothetical protein C7T94_04595 [Pedobacter yulinensis]|uniref:DUF2268 domain-containing protein n=1 Tax=Pedobacter yulinensis TaxID=2126353 RepID=A0A2T3HNQ5_9SPHI|nr:DUF2268 domain-containing putative Zn-dependent protease [Pedobacter yulinensis]PST84021.1 hypothetical protein C7T94_04595 [Pedobacter yulinensis]